MKFLLPLLLLFSISLIPVGCGVHVGNGVQSYSSPMGFDLQYPPELKPPTVTADGTVTFSNANLLPPNSDAVSTAKIYAMAPPTGGAHPIRTSNEFFEWASGRVVSGGVRDQRNVPGGAMLSRKKYDTSIHGEQMDGTYYFFVQSASKLFQGEVRAYKVGRGFELIAPLLDSFRGR